MADPWMKFYTNDWASDPKLRMCSLAARGLWIEMICIMHEAEPYGHLLVSGLTPTDMQLAMLVGTPPNQIPDLIGELEQVGVFSRTRKSVIYSRKMTRAYKKAATARKNGQNGGNPRLSKQRINSTLDKPPLKPPLKPQKPEARSQSISVDKSTSCPFSDFWTSWPNKVSKSVAEKAWNRLSRSQQSEAAKNAPTWFSCWRQQNPQASPIHAATYLNQKRWQDEASSVQDGQDDDLSRWRKLSRVSQ